MADAANTACIYCGKTGATVMITREHTFSDWINEVLTPADLGPTSLVSGTSARASCYRLLSRCIRRGGTLCKGDTRRVSQRISINVVLVAGSSYCCPARERGMRCGRSQWLPSGDRYWTVLDDELCVVPQADGFLRQVRLGRDGSELTTKAYAGAIALFLRWCDRTGRSWQAGIEHLGLFITWMRHAGPGASGLDADGGGTGEVLVAEVPGSRCAAGERGADRCARHGDARGGGRAGTGLRDSTAGR